jgi:hypothetical protein
MKIAVVSSETFTIDSKKFGARGGKAIAAYFRLSSFISHSRMVLCTSRVYQPNPTGTLFEHRGYSSAAKYYCCNVSVLNRCCKDTVWGVYTSSNIDLQACNAIRCAPFRLLPIFSKCKPFWTHHGCHFLTYFHSALT